MSTDYIQTALRRARCEWLADDGLHYCEISDLPGVWASGEDEAATRAELHEVLEGWIALGSAMRHPFSPLDGVEFEVRLGG